MLGQGRQAAKPTHPRIYHSISECAVELPAFMEHQHLPIKNTLVSPIRYVWNHRAPMIPNDETYLRSQPKAKVSRKRLHVSSVTKFGYGSVPSWPPKVRLVKQNHGKYYVIMTENKTFQMIGSKTGTVHNLAYRHDYRGITRNHNAPCRDSVYGAVN